MKKIKRSKKISVLLLAILLASNCVDIENLAINQTNEQEEPIVCVVCSKSFKREEDLENHFNAKHGSVQCDVCGKWFKTEEGLESHFNAKHGSVQCNVCRKWFKTEEGLENHCNAKHKKKKYLFLLGKHTGAQDLTPYQGPDRRYGYYQCSCGKEWESANSWANIYQICKRCDKNIYPYKQTKLESSGSNISKKEHPQHLCQKCIQLGYYCRADD